jgi:hypothetical protein
MSNLPTQGGCRLTTKKPQGEWPFSEGFRLTKPPVSRSVLQTETYRETPHPEWKRFSHNDGRLNAFFAQES